MDDLELITDHEDRSVRAREYLSQEYRDLINALKAEIEDEPTAGMLAVLVSALKAYGEMYQVRAAPGAGKITEVQMARMIAAAVDQERTRVLEAVRQERLEAASQAGRDVRENLKALSDKSLG